MLAQDPQVESIQEDALFYPTLVDSTSIVGAVSGWAKGFTGAAQTVAILDTGVDKAHDFFAGKVVSEACYSTNSATSVSVCPGGVSSSIAPGSGVPCLDPGCFHGTHVAGIAAGNGAGSSGVGQGANIIAVQVFSQRPTGISAFVSDVDLGLQRVYALRTAFNIAAANMSLGGGQFFSNCDALFGTTKAAIDLLRSAGIASVISSGNSGWTDSIGAPACISTGIAVGSTTKGDVVSSFSNMGPQVHLLAPGSSIRYSIPNNLFGFASGTSMAAPHVTGAWALMKEKKPQATVTEVLEAFQNSGALVTDMRLPFNAVSSGLAPAAGFARKRINVSQALDLLGPSGPEEVVLVDFDGDGRDDVLVYNRTTGVWEIRRTTAAGALEAYRTGGWTPGWSTYKADFDNDGMTDLFLHNLATGAWFKVLNNGVAPFTYFGGGWIPGLVPYILELNGDGLADIFLYNPGNGIWFKSFSTGTGRVGFTYIAGGWRAGWTLHQADFNGDGLGDFFLFDETTGGWFKAMGNGGAGFQYHAGGWLTGYNRHVVDLNGDGMSDIFLINPVSGHWFKCVSTGNGTTGFAYQSGGWIPGFNIHITNFDGNAAQDFFLYNPTSSIWYKVVNNGATFSYSGGGWAPWRLAGGDLTNDGSSDFLLFSPLSRFWYIAATSTPAQFTYTSGLW
jgi:subtilisin family serine protease